MCGIVGYAGKKQALDILINGLLKLEYRGYDSAGIALYNEQEKIKIIKCKGRISKLKELTQKHSPKGTIGIGHTRWATHGAPNTINSHPHLSSLGNFAVVHNGIIENYIEIKQFLKNKDIRFLSKTDTEAVAHLIEYNYKDNFMEAVLKSINALEGSYALGVLCSKNPDCFIAAKKDSPLIIGKGEEENFIASDIPAVLEYTRDVYILEDREAAWITKDDIKIIDNLGGIKNRKIFHVNWNIDCAKKGGFKHFMLKEIYEEPGKTARAIESGIKEGVIKFNNPSLEDEKFLQVNKIHIIACGTAYHAGLIGKYIFEKHTGIPVEVHLASEFRYKNPIINKNHLAVIISQSGETIDTLFALREAKKKGAKTLSIVNVMGSSIARESDNVLYTWAGPEIAVASTKAYNTQLAVLYLLTLYTAKKINKIDQIQYLNLINDLRDAPNKIQYVIDNLVNDIQKAALEHYNAKSIFFIGRGLDYALSMEGSLKLKEISYIHSEAYAGGELKHGTIALIEEGTMVVCSMTQDNLIGKMVSNIKEVKARGAFVLTVTYQKHKNIVNEIADKVILIPDMNNDFAPIAAVTVMQLFAYYTAVEKGCDVDKPRNLAKSVVVE